MGLFDRLATLHEVEHQRPDQQGRESGEDAEPDRRRTCATSWPRRSSRLPPPSPMRSVCTTRPTPRSSSPKDWEKRAMLAVQEGPRRSRQAGARPPAGTRVTRAAAASHVGIAQGRDREAQEFAPRSERQDRRGQAQEEPAPGPASAAPRRSSASHKTMGSMSEKGAFEAFARMEERIEHNERKVKASAEIDEEFSGDKLANDFKQLERQAGGLSADQAARGAQTEDGSARAGRPASPPRRSLSGSPGRL